MVRIRAHMVSRAYLQAWADSRNRVDVLDFEDGRGFPSAIGNATVASEVYATNVLAQDVEKLYAGVEDKAIRVIVKLIQQRAITPSEKTDMIQFLDMHLDRGRYANRSRTRVPASLMTLDGQAKDGELNLGDVLLLSQYVTGVVRLRELGLENWPWQVLEAKYLATGDGAVLLWKATSDAPLSTVSFPLSPTKLLVIGKELPPHVQLNELLAANSRRWLIGQFGTLNYSQAAVTQARRAEEGTSQEAASGPTASPND